MPTQWDHVCEWPCAMVQYRKRLYHHRKGYQYIWIYIYNAKKLHDFLFQQKSCEVFIPPCIYKFMHALSINVSGWEVCIPSSSSIRLNACILPWYCQHFGLKVIATLRSPLALLSTAFMNQSSHSVPVNPLSSTSCRWSMEISCDVQ